MSMRAWLLLAGLWASGWCAAMPAQASLPGVVADDTPRQILLMLRAAPPHYRPDTNYVDGYRTAPGREARRRMARALAREHGLQLRTDWPMPALGLDCFVLDAADRATAGRALQALATDSRVESVQPMQRFHLLAGHTPPRPDPLYPAQPTASGWRLTELHARTTGKGVLVAVVDSGVAAAHPDLRGQIAATRNFVDDSGEVAEAHGTEVAGIIAARAGNGIGIVGIAPQSRLLALRACAQAGNGSSGCSSFALARALQFAIERKAQVLNLSLSGPPDRLLGRLLDAAMARGISVVGAVDAQARDGGFPASHAGVLAVAEHGTGHPPVAALLAPGQGIPTTLPDGGWGLVTGPSYAAAQVSGLVALLRQLSPGLKPERLRSVLAPATGLGLAAERPQPIDACAALLRVDGRCACNCATTSSTTLVMPRQ